MLSYLAGLISGVVVVLVSLLILLGWLAEKKDGGVSE